MKATEFKIGDCVAYKGKPARIQALDSPCIYVEVDREIWGALEDDGDIAPIPLTEEILEKNEWHRQSINVVMQGWSNGYVELYPQDKNSCFVFAYSGHKVQYIHYVHQLQHILWALGMSDNLKI